MPTRHGFTVNVTTVDGEAFTEYGDQNIGTCETSRLVSCMVRAIDGQKFYIHVKPECPFLHGGPSESYLPSEKPARKVRSGARYNFRQLNDRIDYNTSRTKQHIAQEQPAYKFAFWIYIEGNEEAECAGILDIDHQNEGQIMQGRYSAPKGRTSAEVSVHEWQFTPRGIDILLSKMDITVDAETPDAVQQEVDEVTEALDNLTSTKSRRKPGQIEVRFAKILDLGHHSSPEGCWQREAHEHNETTSPDTDGTDIHSINVNQTSQYEKTLKPRLWRLYDADEACYARFIFQAMDLPKLVQLNLATPDGKKQTRLKKSPENVLTIPNASQRVPWKPIEASPQDSGLGDEDSSSSDEDDSSGEDETRARKRRGGNIRSLIPHPSGEAPPDIRKTVGGQKKVGNSRNGDTNNVVNRMQIIQALKNDEDEKEKADSGYQLVESNGLQAEAEQGALKLVQADRDEADEADEANEVEDGRGKLELVQVDEDEIEQIGEDQVEW